MKANQLDGIDIKILVTLQKNGRVTNVELANSVGLSPSGCLTRVKRLEKAGVIGGYGAYLNIDWLGPNVTAYAMITLSNQRPEHFQRFEDRAVSMPEVLDCHRISGESDYMVKFLCRDTNVFYESVNRLVKEDQNIRSYWTIIALKRITLSSEEFPIYMLRGQLPPSGFD